MIALVRLSLLTLIPLAPLVALSNYEDYEWIEANPGPHELTALMERYGQPVNLWRVTDERIWRDSEGAIGDFYGYGTTHNLDDAGRLEFSAPNRTRRGYPYTVIAYKLQDGWHLSRRPTLIFKR